MGDAHPVLHYRRDLANGDIIQVVVWLLPQPLPGSTHNYKYRLHYQQANGAEVIRFDNERGKGDHQHIGNTESPYQFSTVRQLVFDFYAAIRAARRQGGLS